MSFLFLSIDDFKYVCKFVIKTLTKSFPTNVDMHAEHDKLVAFL